MQNFQDPAIAGSNEHFVAGATVKKGGARC